MIAIYTRQKSRAAWGTYKSDYFCMHNGAKQRAIIYPILFTVYIDDLLISLKRSCIGCHIDNQYMGASVYADDINLSCPSIKRLNLMLNICNVFVTENNILFKCKKSVYIKYGFKESEIARLGGIGI